MPARQTSESAKRDAGRGARIAHRLLALASFLWLALLLVWISDTGVGFPVACVATAGTLAIVLAAAVAAFTTRTAARSGLLLLWPLPLLPATLACGAIFIGSQNAGNPLFQLRFALSRAQLDALAAAPDATIVQARRVGLFSFDRVEIAADGIRLLRFGCGVVDSCGLAFLPGPAPAPRAKSRLQHVAGAWYHLYEPF